MPRKIEEQYDEIRGRRDRRLVLGIPSTRGRSLLPGEFRLLSSIRKCICVPPTKTRDRRHVSGAGVVLLEAALEGVRLIDVTG